MAEIVYMPKLSDTMVEGVVASWNKKVGDQVASGEVLAEIETDKATMEFESFYDGVLLHIGVETGKTAPVNSVLAIIGNAGEDVTALLANAGAVPVAETVAPEAVKAEPVAEVKPISTPAAAPTAPKPAPVTANPNAGIFKYLATNMDYDTYSFTGSPNGSVTIADFEPVKD